MGVEILVEAMDVGIDMMQLIMLLAPQHLAPPEQIERASHEPVDFFVFGVAIVRTIMRDIETHQRKTLCQRKHREHCHDERRGKKDQEHVRYHEPGQQHPGFHKHTPVAGFGQAAVRKILRHALLDGIVKPCASRKTDFCYQGNRLRLLAAAGLLQLTRATHQALELRGHAL